MRKYVLACWSFPFDPRGLLGTESIKLSSIERGARHEPSAPFFLQSARVRWSQVLSSAGADVFLLLLGFSRLIGSATWGYATDRARTVLLGTVGSALLRLIGRRGCGRDGLGCFRCYALCAIGSALFLCWARRGLWLLRLGRCDAGARRVDSLGRWALPRRCGLYVLRRGSGLLRALRCRWRVLGIVTHRWLGALAIHAVAHRGFVFRGAIIL